MTVKRSKKTDDYRLEWLYNHRGSRSPDQVYSQLMSEITQLSDRLDALLCHLGVVVVPPTEQPPFVAYKKGDR